MVQGIVLKNSSASIYTSHYIVVVNHMWYQIRIVLQHSYGMHASIVHQHFKLLLWSPVLVCLSSTFLYSSFSFFIFALHCSAVLSFVAYFSYTCLFLFAPSSCCINFSTSLSFQFATAINTSRWLLLWLYFTRVIPVLFILALGTVLDSSDHLILDGTDLFRMIQVYIASINGTVLV